MFNIRFSDVVACNSFKYDVLVAIIILILFLLTKIYYRNNHKYKLKMQYSRNTTYLLCIYLHSSYRSLRIFK